MYNRLRISGATSWNQVEAEFLAAISDFDGGLPEVFGDAEKPRQSKELSAALQNDNIVLAPSFKG